MVAASMLMCLPAVEIPSRLNATAIGETYTGTSKAVPEAHTLFDCSTSSALKALSEPAQAVEPVRNVLTPAPDPDGL